MIRAATEHDLLEIRELVKLTSAFWHTEWRPEAWRRAMRASNGLSFVWDEAGDLLGFVCVHDIGQLGYLCTLVAVESARDKNIGKELIRRVQGELAAQGYATILSEFIGFRQARERAAFDLILLQRTETNWPMPER